jgi:hypothetical protein
LFEELNQQWETYRKVLADKLVLRKYTPVKGDQIDELFAHSLNATKYSEIPVVRLSKTKYKFGEKEFRANVKNNKLIIQVGGGYMSVDEYINQYGPIELDKIIYRDIKKRQGVKTSREGLPLLSLREQMTGESKTIQLVRKTTDQHLEMNGSAIKRKAREALQKTSVHGQRIKSEPARIIPGSARLIKANTAKETLGQKI